MKKVILFFGLTIYFLSCFSQKSGLFKDTTDNNVAIYLSQDKIISNEDYPSILKDSIKDFKNKLNLLSAEEILSSSLILTESPLYYETKIDNGLQIILKQQFRDVIKVQTIGNMTETTYTNRYEKKPIFIPFREVRFIRVKKFYNSSSFKSHYEVQFVTKVTLGQGPYYGNNKFLFTVNSNAKELTLIASLLYLFSNIKDSRAINY